MLDIYIYTLLLFSFQSFRANFSYNKDSFQQIFSRLSSDIWKKDVDAIILETRETNQGFDEDNL